MSILSLQGKVLVIIGGTSGIGRSAAQAFLAAGAKIVVIGRDKDKVGAAEKKLGDRARVMQGDACRPETSERAIEMALTSFGEFHGLYHVAGGSGREVGDGPLHEISDAAWDETLRLNLTAAMFSNRAAVRQLQKQKSGGTILNISSVLGFSPSPRYFTTHAYAAAKAAIIGLTKSLAAYYAPVNIRFNVIVPALVETPMSRRAVTSEAIMKFIKTKQPLDGGRVGQASDLDAAAVYFMSDGSRFTTGQVLAVDGGWEVSEGQFG
ncbi:MAG TPA: SDR family oxidoreductase [Acidobacteriota bacterium]|jgi:NAD(P)-dependent dehydrogenase (short-subunit alcohol dehydrogenase family)